MKKKILIVEDDKDLVYVLQRMVGLLGHETFHAKNGKEALNIATTKLPDLIILDIMMPELDGFEVARQIRANQVTHEIPIIAVTALTAFKDKQKCFDSGCNDYIPKPMIPAKLAASVEKLLKSPPSEQLGR